jgi:hypothetical protein
MVRSASPRLDIGLRLAGWWPVGPDVIAVVAVVADSSFIALGPAHRPAGTRGGRGG